VAFNSLALPRQTDLLAIGGTWRWGRRLAAVRYVQPFRQTAVCIDIKSKSKLTIFHKILIVISLTLIAISFTQTGLYIDGVEDLSGWKIFFLGWLGIFQAKLGNQWYTFIIWLANPFYVIALTTLIGGKTSSSIFSCLSTLLAIALIFVANNKNLLDKLYIDAVGPGYYWWLAGIIVLTCTTLLFDFFASSDNNSGRQKGSL
jgi:hypothetical protein